LGIALGVVGVLLLIGLVVGGVAYQIIHRRSELAQLDLLGSWREITKAQSAIIKITKKHTELGSHISMDHKGLLDNTFLSNLTVTATFRATRVILRVCERDQLHITRSVLSEIKAVRSIQNDNVAKLEGLCTGPHRVAVMYSFAAKGSLAVSQESSYLKSSSPIGFRPDAWMRYQNWIAA
jgi:atrial natriuretic peptide receptor A